jgi:hypothetical protein
MDVLLVLALALFLVAALAYAGFPAILRPGSWLILLSGVLVLALWLVL